jgi:hypothetical protein
MPLGFKSVWSELIVLLFRGMRGATETRKLYGAQSFQNFAPYWHKKEAKSFSNALLTLGYSL